MHRSLANPVWARAEAANVYAKDFLSLSYKVSPVQLTAFSN